MSESTLDVLTRRLDGLERTNQRLERECRWWKRAGLGCLAGLAVLMIGGAASRTLSTIEAREFVLRDQNGTMRAALAIRPDGTPGLGLFDGRGKPRLSLDTGFDGTPGLNLFDPNERLRAALAIRPDGTPGLGLFDGEGLIRQSVDYGMEGKLPETVR